MGRARISALKLKISFNTVSSAVRRLFKAGILFHENDFHVIEFFIIKIISIFCGKVRNKKCELDIKIIIYDISYFCHLLIVKS